MSVGIGTMCISMSCATLRKWRSRRWRRFSFGTTILLDGVDLRSIREAKGHANFTTKEIYTHVVKAMQGKLRSPLNNL